MTEIQHVDHGTTHRTAERHVVPGVSWPVPPIALAALTDMGMSDEVIARYFGISASLVRQEREKDDR